MRKACVILAGGLGTRMGRQHRILQPKVLRTLLGREMLGYALDAAFAVKPEKVIVVSGRESDGPIKETLSRYNREHGKNAVVALQEKPLGTAHALLAGLKTLKNFRGTVIVLNGDCPLIEAGTIRRFLSRHKRSGKELSIGSFVAVDPGAYGRVLRDEAGAPRKIVELADLTPGETSIKEVNSGLYAMEPECLRLVSSIKPNRKKGEYYLTDILHLAREKGLGAGVYESAGERELAGVNTVAELQSAELVLREKLIGSLMKKGVRFIDPKSVYIGWDVRVAPGSVIYPNVHLEGRTSLAGGCVIYPNTRITDSSLKEGAVVRDSCLIENSVIGRNVQVGPFAHLRPGNVLSDSAKIGNFVELKNTRVGRGTKAMHLSYLGDSAIGDSVNIGAGTITCNYDGLNKHCTVIESGVFIGSGSQLVAPVVVKKGSYVAAGSTIVNDVPGGALAITRGHQKNIAGWASCRKKSEAGKSRPKGRQPRSSRKSGR
jgi:bifunctional UDP-N-acetylglucosamine pyrophosphorylase/glucosamine-1-phosphate N-acetyltransferase